MRTPCAAEAEGGALSPALAREYNQTLRLSGQMIDMVNPDQLPQTRDTLLKTPTAQLAVNGGSQDPDKRKAGGHGPTLADEVEHRLLPTPVASEGLKATNRQNADQKSKTGQVWLTNVAHTIREAGELFPTPKASDGEKGGPNQRGSSGDYALPAIGNLLPTPITTDAKGTGPADANRVTTQLRAVHSLLPTPTVGNATGGNASRSGDRSDERLLPGLAVDIANDSAPLLPTPTTQEGKSGPSQEFRNTPPLNARVLMLDEPEVQATNWGAFEPAIRRWEHILGRPAPSPTEPTKAGNHRLASAFVQWMMGLPEGHVTDVGLSRNMELKALGNGVVPQQGAVAITHLLTHQWLFELVDQRNAA